MNQILSGLIQRAHDLGVIDSISEDSPSSVVLQSGSKKLTIDSIQGGDPQTYLLWSSEHPEVIYDIQGAKAVPIVSRLILQYFMGLTSGRFQGRTYSNAILVPTAVEDDGLVLESADHRKFLLTSGDAGGNAGNITLGFYNLVYDTNGEHWAMSMPQLYDRDKIKVGIKSSVDPVFSVDTYLSYLPSSLDSLTVCPRVDTVPIVGTAITSGRVVTSADGKALEDLNKLLNTYLYGVNTPGYIPPKYIKSQITHQDISKEIIKSDGFTVKALDNGTLQINTVRHTPTSEIYSSFTAAANLFKAESYLKATGTTPRMLKSGVDLSGEPEADKFKEFLVSSAKFNVLESPQISRKLVYQGLEGEKAQERFTDLGFDTSLGILKSVRQLLS